MKEALKQNADLIIILIIVIGISAVSLFVFSRWTNAEEVTHDPIYNQKIISDNPVLVQTSRVTGDKTPHFHRVWYNPQTEEYYYTVEVGQ